MTRRSDAGPDPRRERDLIVIGGGPVGIAALWNARLRGMDAVVLEAGPSPLGTLRRFTPSLVMASTAHEWEIGGIPLDCRSAREITREDLLSYYARVIALGELPIVCDQHVIDIVATDERVRVEVETRSGRRTWSAKNLIVTPWYRRRALDLGPSIAVPDSVSDANLVGEDVVVVGAGISGLEVAEHAIRSGTPVTLLARRKDRLPVDQATLFRASGSRIIEGVTRISVDAPNVIAVEHEGTVTHVACTVALNCTGHQPNTELLDVLLRAGLLSNDEHAALARFRPATLIDDRRELKDVAQELPPLADALWSGRRGVRFAGTVFHIGGIFGAGILYSIETARWAVDSIAGQRDDDAPATHEHLAPWFLRMLDERPFYPSRVRRWADVAKLIPIPIPTWSRGILIIEGETPSGGVGFGVSRASRALGAAQSEALSDLREACYDALSVEELAQKHEIDREDLLSGLNELWYGNGLTWIPPARAREPAPR